MCFGLEDQCVDGICCHEFIFLKDIEDLQGDAELSDGCNLSRSPHEDCLAEDIFVNDVRWSA